MDNREDTVINELLYDAVKSTLQESIGHMTERASDLGAQKTKIFVHYLCV